MQLSHSSASQRHVDRNHNTPSRLPILATSHMLLSEIRLSVGSQSQLKREKIHYEPHTLMILLLSGKSSVNQPDCELHIALWCSVSCLVGHLSPAYGDIESVHLTVYHLFVYPFARQVVR